VLLSLAIPSSLPGITPGTDNGTGHAGPPPLRREVLLDGLWNFTPLGGLQTTIAVPEFWDAAPHFTTTRARYQRWVTVPDAWIGKRINVEFCSVNQVADVYVNGTLVGSHVGGWTPFGFDITSLVEPGQTFSLAVDVRGGALPPIVDSAGHPAWPVGWYGHRQQWGIGDDVYLRAYGVAHIEGAFIQTSYRARTLTIAYSLRNADDRPHTVSVRASAMGDSTVEVSLAGPTLTLSPGERHSISMSVPWDSPALWTPEHPNLYLLESQLVEDGQVVDEETRRFGFREFWVEGNHFVLNGVRLNLWGSSMTAHAQGFRDARYSLLTPTAWPATIDRMKSVNIRILRFHQQPPPVFVLDVADEKGLLVIAESAVYARSYLYGSDRNRYLRNSARWIPEWVKSERNHPSIVLWSASNEMEHPFRLLPASQIRSLGDSISAYDPTRPVIYEGEGDEVGGAVVNYHYPEGYGHEPSGSIYGWDSLVHADKPTGVGELLVSYGVNGEFNRWWQGTWTRGMRYAGFADIRPYSLEWAWTNPDTPQITNLRNSLNPVALFDNAYDDLGIGPLTGGGYPSFPAGAQSLRTLVLYNDDDADSSVSVEVTTKIGTTTYSTLHRTYSVALGDHIEIPYTLQVPAAPGAILEMVLMASKGGAVRFRETKAFSIPPDGRD
jgi:glycosyl hydrolase family 2